MPLEETICALQEQASEQGRARRGLAVRLLSAEPVPALPGPRLGGVRVRRIMDGDLGFLCDLYATTRAEELAASGWPQQARQEFLAQQFQFQHRYYQAHYGDADFLLLLLHGQPVGRLYWREHGTQATLIDLSLLPAHRGLGLGTALLEILAAHADSLRQSISLHVEPSNPARRLYERFGFTTMATYGVYLKMRRPPGTPASHEENRDEHPQFRTPAQ